VDGSEAGDPGGEDTGEERYRMVSGARASVEYEWFELVAERWRAVLDLAAPGVALSVRVVGGATPMVRSECGASGVGALVELLCKVPEGGAGLVPPPPGVRRVRGDVMDDPARVNPGWYAVLPGVDYTPGAQAAYAMADELDEIFGRLLPGGAVEVAPDWWQDGSGEVRFDLEPEDAVWLTALALVLLGVEGEHGG
jgi:hypothetical protein